MKIKILCFTRGVSREEGSFSFEKVIDVPDGLSVSDKEVRQIVRNEALKYYDWKWKEVENNEN